MFCEVYTKGTWEVETCIVELDLREDGIAEKIADIATSEKVRKKARAVVDKKMGHFFGTGPGSEINQITEDALNSVITGLLSAHAEKTTSLTLETDSNGVKDLSAPIVRYLIGGVNNYCNTRLNRWSTNKNDEDRETGTRARYYIDSDLSDGADFWDQHLSHEDNLDSVDRERVEAMLFDRGVSSEDIVLIRRKLEGWSFVDLAGEFGGTPDKYRRRISRALEGAGIDIKLLK